MLDFEDVTPRKRNTEENNEPVTEQAAEEMQEVQPAEEPAEQPAAEKVEEEKPLEEEKPSFDTREYHYEEQVKKAPKKKKGWMKFIAGCLVIGIAGGGSIGAGYSLVDHLMTGRNAVSGTPTGVQKASSGEVYSAVEIVRAVKPSVVSVESSMMRTSLSKLARLAISSSEV